MIYEVAWTIKDGKSLWDDRRAEEFFTKREARKFIVTLKAQGAKDIFLDTFDNADDRNLINYEAQ